MAILMANRNPGRPSAACSPSSERMRRRGTLPDVPLNSSLSPSIMLPEPPPAYLDAEDGGHLETADLLPSPCIGHREAARALNVSFSEELHSRVATRHTLTGSLEAALNIV